MLREWSRADSAAGVRESKPITPFPGPYPMRATPAAVWTLSPRKRDRFSEVWRRVANAAGVPRAVWSMDARSGAISELYDAGASAPDAMKHAGHQDPRMSARYNRSSLEQTRRAAQQRQHKRLQNRARGRDRDV
jgi:hypothetical protein